jgi:hypothetical protein
MLASQSRQEPPRLARLPYLPQLVWLRWQLVTFVLANLLAGCHLGAIKAPYQPGQGPTEALLRESLVPRMHAIRIGDARVREGARPAASLALIAQSPSRLYANVHFSGQEIFTLAFNENEYGFRSLRVDGLKNGFYSGKTTDCIVERLLGIRLAPTSVVSLFLGGGPELDASWRNVEQSWDRRAGAEKLVLASADATSLYRLWFRWHSGAWFVTRVVYAQRKGKDFVAKWELEHEDLALSHGRVVPTRTSISNHEANSNLSIVYKAFEAEPRLDVEVQNNEPEDWDDTEGWEDEEGQAVPASATQTQSLPAATRASSKPAASGMPRAFIPRGDGLSLRGELCHDR